jgi:hypothetical protein
MELLAQVVLHLLLILFVVIAVPLSMVVALATIAQELISGRYSIQSVIAR